MIKTVIKDEKVFMNLFL